MSTEYSSNLPQKNFEAYLSLAQFSGVDDGAGVGAILRGVTRSEKNTDMKLYVKKNEYRQLFISKLENIEAFSALCCFVH